MPEISVAPLLNTLKAPIQKFGWAALLVCVLVYETLTNPQPYDFAFAVVVLVILATVAVMARAPRWVAYGLLAVALVIRLYAFTIIISSGAQDKDSTRDAAVEVTAAALLHGENAWNANPGVPATTGPTSILLALPFVFVFGTINGLSFAFWVLFFLALLAFDLHYQNDTWPTLVMLFMLGLFSFEHTLFWSLEELYYPVLFLVLAYWLATRRQWWGVGALAAACLLSRLNYVFLLMGLGYWYLFEFQFSWRALAKMGAGFLLGGAAILLPFVMVGGSDFWVHNPWRVVQDFSGAAWPNTNVVFHALNQVKAQIGSGPMQGVKLGLTLLIMLGVAWGLRRSQVRHPFWHITAGALIAHTLVWLPAQWPHDYALIFVLPAMLGIALMPGRLSESAQPLSLNCQIQATEGGKGVVAGQKAAGFGTPAGGSRWRD
jgi:hypothetical protein